MSDKNFMKLCKTDTVSFLLTLISLAIVEFVLPLCDRFLQYVSF